MLQIKTIPKKHFDFDIFEPSPLYTQQALARDLNTLSEETTQRKHTHALLLANNNNKTSR